jgi:hypothetical protein
LFKIIRHTVILFCCSLGFILLPHAACALSITLAWDPSPDTDVVGYRIYYGTESRNYSRRPINVGNVTEYTINGLLKNEIYYFALTALDSEGKESEYSAEAATASEFSGTARLFAREKHSDSCEMQEVGGDGVEVSMAFDFLNQDRFIFESDNRWMDCRAGSFIQNDDGTFDASCDKKGPFGIFTLFRLKFSGMGNVSAEYPWAVKAEVYSLFDDECPLYVLEMDYLFPPQ